MQKIGEFKTRGLSQAYIRKNACDISQAFNSQFSILNFQLLFAFCNDFKGSVQNCCVIK